MPVEEANLAVSLWERLSLMLGYCCNSHCFKPVGEAQLDFSLLEKPTLMLAVKKSYNIC